MASGNPTTWGTFGEYRFDLTDRLRQAAQSSLAELEASINRDGYDWLDDYIDNIQAQGRRAPIAELIKTPSRTATAKKTRAAANASKARAEQALRFNLALSPLAAKSPEGRLPFSPLQSRLLNAIPQSPTPKSPANGKGAAAITKDKGKAPATKPKRTRQAKNVKVADVATGEAKASPSKVMRGVEPMSSAPVPKEKPAAPVPTLVLNKPLPDVPADTTMDIDADPAMDVDDDDVPEFETAPQTQTDDEPEFETAPQTQTTDIEDRPEPVSPSPSPIKAAYSPHVSSPLRHSSTPIQETVPLVDVTTPTKARSPAKPQSPTKAASPVKSSSPAKIMWAPTPPKKSSPVKATSPTAVAILARSPSPVKAPSPTKMSSPAKTSPAKTSPVKTSPIKTAAAKTSSPVKESSPVKDSSPAKETSAPNEPVIPTRQVRSSWLSQALGSRTVPINMPRPSASTQQEQALRKSVAAGKRKSHDGPAGDETKAADKEGKRPDKVARFDAEATDAVSGKPVSPRQTSGSRSAASAASLPATATLKTPKASLPHPTATSVPQDARDRQRTNDKVAKKIDEMRERAAAKPSSRPPVGAGFLRGLGNLGAGLFGVNAAEEEAARLRREQEDKMAHELAEQELQRVMRHLADDDKSGAKATATAEKAQDAPAPEPAMADVEPPASEPIDDDDDMDADTEDNDDDNDEDNIGDVAIVVDDDEDEAEDAVDDSVSLPELPPMDSDSEMDVDDAPTSALGRAGITILVDQSTTPTDSPPRKKAPLRKAPSPTPIRKAPSRAPSRQPSSMLSPPRAKPAATPGRFGAPIRTKGAASRPPTASSVNDEDEDEEPRELRTRAARTPRSRMVSTASTSTSALNASTMSQTSTLSQAERMAAKALGVKAAAGPVKSLKSSAQAKRQEQEAAERRLQLRQQNEQRRAEEKQRKAEEEQRKADEERKRKAAEAEDKRRRWEEQEKRRKAAEAKMARLQKEKAAREEREASEARAKQAEEEAARKRKMAPMINKNAGTIKRIVPTVAATAKGKEVMHPSKTVVTLNQSTTSMTASQARLGPPQRTSQVPQHGSHAAHAGPSSSAVLQHSRVTLQAQLDQKALEMASEDIVLPDIASEYSNSDDSDREDDFKRPDWAESPNLHRALEEQASVNPDELFGPVRPLVMDELFKARQGKFRARTSSANWSGADRLTEAEEREYARRMGFNPINAPRDGGASGR